MTYLLEYFIEEYNIHKKVTNDGYVHVEVRKVMHGLPHQGLIVNQILE